VTDKSEENQGMYHAAVGKALAARTPGRRVEDTKETNPKDAVGVRKSPISTIPFRVLAGIGLALLEGARKYGRHNYRVAGVRASVYLDAVMMGHLGPWWEGEDIDPDSGLNHIDKAIAGLMVLRDSMLAGNWTDDRPPAAKPGWRREANVLAGEIIDRYPNALPPFTELGQRQSETNELGELCSAYIAKGGRKPRVYSADKVTLNLNGKLAEGVEVKEFTIETVEPVRMEEPEPGDLVEVVEIHPESCAVIYGFARVGQRGTLLNIGETDPKGGFDGFPLCSVSGIGKGENYAMKVRKVKENGK